MKLLSMSIKTDKFCFDKWSMSWFIPVLHEFKKYLLKLIFWVGLDFYKNTLFMSSMNGKLNLYSLQVISSMPNLIKTSHLFIFLKELKFKFSSLHNADADNTTRVYEVY